MSVGMQMLAGGAAIGILGVVTGELPRVNFDAMTMKSIGGLAYLTIVGSLAFAAYVRLLNVSTPAKVSTYAFVNPVVAVFLDWLLGGEEITARIIVAATIIISAVAVITIYKNKKASQPVVPPARALPEVANTCINE